MRHIRQLAKLRPILLILILLSAAPAWALSPDDIALVVNSRVPEGRALAEFYAQQRHIPAGRIIEVDLNPISPFDPAEEMPFDDFEPKVAAPVRAFLRRNNLQDRVRCLVTFWGMPLRIGAHRLNPEESVEAARVNKESADALAAIQQDVAALELSASQLDPSFKPPTGQTVRQLARRLDAALPVIVKGISTLKDPAARTARYAQMLSVIQRLLGSDRAILIITQPAVAQFSTHQLLVQDVTAAQGRLEDVQKQIAALQSDKATPADRASAESLAHDHLGLIGYAFLLANRQQALSTDQSESALDSELSMLWWSGYPRARWVLNPLEWRTAIGFRVRNVQAPATLMVTRLDGPAVPIVRNLILTSIKVEAEGLRGQVAIDARGKTGKDPYAQYDERLRRLAELLKQKTKLQVTLDNSPALIPAHSLQNIGIYCGWYSLRNFSSPGSFSPGAVGFHVASLELLSLRQPNEHGWVRGLLSEGVVGTLGAVAEPYLESFPPADEFFPLLMTGRLTLAETYWKTLPWTSWMQTCIGDPLYNPYKTDPPLAVADLPADLGSALAPPELSSPATQPVAPPK